ncbi:MAG: SDR family oxidoreductase [Myxococcota bacterium]|jgi:NAD(P)-dependent dehydrogenase (short-subunit alcohol dehydrogenase family)|nr:SDR family oxidoreductase [Myxococcota bacterium]
MKRVLITGANSGIGRSTAIVLAAKGYEVFAGMRNLEKATKLLQGAADANAELKPVVLDVNDDASVREAVASIEAQSGPVDILINNAGIALNAAVEDVDIQVGKEVFETNFWGLIRCTQAVLPAMRKQGSGHVVNISSVAGRIAAIGQMVYSASKWAVESMSENLAQEVAPFGIRVSIVEPGVTRTAILAKNMGHPEPTEYETPYRRMLQFYARGVMANTPAEEVATVIHGALEDPNPKLRYPCAWGGEELCSGRTKLDDAAWVALGACESDDEYYAAFEKCFGLDIRPASE